jgi:hypothetical protein
MADTFKLDLNIFDFFLLNLIVNKGLYFPLNIFLDIFLASWPEYI